jgi:hypothetical protein
MEHRKVLSRDDLNAYLTEQIRQVEDLEDASLRISYILREADSTGCNWSSDFHLNPGTSGAASYAQPHAKEIIEKARATFNVKSG